MTDRYYCPQHKGSPIITIDTWPPKCGTCCKMNGGPGTPGGGCCPVLWYAMAPEDFAAIHARRPFADDEYELVGAQYFVSPHRLRGIR